MSDKRRFYVGDRLIIADHNEVRFGRVIDRSGSEYRTVFPPDGDRDDVHWCDDEDRMRFVHVEDSAIARAISAAETERDQLRAQLAAVEDLGRRLAIYHSGSMVGADRIVAQLSEALAQETS
jgi:hypothetical protein